MPPATRSIPNTTHPSSVLHAFLLLICLISPLSLAVPLQSADSLHLHHAASRSADASQPDSAPDVLNDTLVTSIPSRLLYAHEHPKPADTPHVHTRSRSTTSASPGTTQAEVLDLLYIPEEKPPSNASGSTFTAYSAPRRETATSRQVYEGPKRASVFVCEVVNAPSNIDVKTAINKVLDVMSTAWASRVTVRARVEFKSLGEPTVLASGGGTYFVRMPEFTTIMPVAAAEAVRGSDLNGGQSGIAKYDVLVTINERTPWHVGSPPTPENSYDLVTVLLHEFYHNLVFAGSVVVELKPYNGKMVQSAYLYNKYRTRFDSFLATAGGCAVLGYLNANQLASQTQLTTSALLATAVCNDALYWWADDIQVAKLHSPRTFMPRSSVYHFDDQAQTLDPGDSLMYPTIRRGTYQHSIGKTILVIQRHTLNPAVKGARSACTLPNPAPKHSPKPAPVGEYVEDKPYMPEEMGLGGARIANLPIWAFILILLFVILLLLLLLTLCLLLCLRRRRRKKSEKGGKSSSFTSSYYRRTRMSHSMSKSGYIPGVGNSSKSKSQSWGGSKSKSSSRKCSSKPSSTPPLPPLDSDPTDKHDTTGDTCPSSGKNKYICCCDCCTPVQRPPPIASVHTFDPNSVPRPAYGLECKKKKKKSKRCHSHHEPQEVHCVEERRHSQVELPVRKVCKKKVTKKVCEGVRYAPSTKGSSSKCVKPTTRCSKTTTTTMVRGEDTACSPPPCAVAAAAAAASSSRGHCSKQKQSHTTYGRRCPPSTKPPTTCPPTTRAKSCKKCKTTTKTCKCEVVEVEVNYRC